MRVFFGCCVCGSLSTIHRNQTPSQANRYSEDIAPVQMGSRDFGTSPRPTSVSRRHSSRSSTPRSEQHVEEAPRAQIITGASWEHAGATSASSSQCLLLASDTGELHRLTLTRRNNTHLSGSEWRHEWEASLALCCYKAAGPLRAVAALPGAAGVMVFTESGDDELLRLVVAEEPAV
uniref:Uncharacterized protein n=1 Tax=Tetraselmis chuii TaxID=63592 RepID=A0A7S1SVP2_9CHLO|mmetsp:Transcript_31942/g.57213  ORF Transcript_31942/g.57213 Transcript_31942/m.57213 type:complete len:177 (+) Transcript_31942:302-832(+)